MTEQKRQLYLAAINALADLQACADLPLDIAEDVLDIATKLADELRPDEGLLSARLTGAAFADWWAAAAA